MMFLIAFKIISCFSKCKENNFREYWLDDLNEKNFFVGKIKSKKIHFFVKKKRDSEFLS